MTLLISIILFIIASFVLVKSGAWLVKSLIQIAAYWRLREFTVAFILMAGGACLPELFVGLTSAFDGNPVLSLGNIVGANIMNMTLVIGLAAILGRGISFTSTATEKNSIQAGLISLAPLILILDRELSRIDGAILLLLFGFYAIFVARQEERFKKKFTHIKKKGLAKNILLFFVGFILLILSAHYIVELATNISYDLNLPLVFIGLFIVAMGTTLPELVFGFRSVTTGHKEMVLGVSLGSVVIDSTIVLGLVALISPIVISQFSLILISSIMVIVAIFSLIIFIRTKDAISWQEGLLLILIYIIFIILELGFKLIS